MHDRQATSSLFPPVDVATPAHAPTASTPERADHEQVRLLRELLASQDRQNELLEELVSQLNSGQRQRTQELTTWKQANPELAHNCRLAAEGLSRVQTAFLQTLTDEVNANVDSLADGEFLLSEFVDRFGPRLAHLNGVLQVLAQLSSTPN
ncbi:MAG TPA: hypothetical protein VHZ24_17285 [Pirellulales bacterium]|jgi:hypothetical protein|nr:hypothetical protein [Pirellulales bacterium]